MSQITNQNYRIQWKKYVECNQYKRQIPWVRDKICNRYKNEIIGNYNNGINQNEGNEQINILRQEIGVINTIPHSSVNINNPDIVHQGYIDTNKHQDCIRLLSLNLRGFGPDNNEKVAMMI